MLISLLNTKKILVCFEEKILNLKKSIKSALFKLLLHIVFIFRANTKKNVDFLDIYENSKNYK